MRRRRALEAALAGGLAALTLAVTWGVVDNAFLVFWDDNRYVTDNPAVLGGLRASGVHWALTTTRMGNWHPLTWLSFMTDVSLFGVDPAAMHGVNALLHAVSVALLFSALLALFRAGPGEEPPGLWLRCALVAALWGLHPLRVESVAWLPERKDLLSGVFFFALLRVYAAYARAPSRTRAAGVALCLTASLLSKATAVTAPVLLLLLDVWPLGRLAWPRPFSARATGRALAPVLREKLPLFALAALFAAVAVVAQRSAGALGSVEVTPLPGRVATALLAAGEYLRQSVWPTGLAAFYPYPGRVMEASEWLGRAGLAAGGLAVLTTVGWLVRRRHPALLFGVVWYLVALAPMSGIVQIGSQGWADRYTYLPLVGPTLALVWLVADAVEALPIGRRRPARLAALVVALVALGALAFGTRRQIRTWADERTLWTHAREVVPRNYKAMLMLGHLAEEEGDSQEARKLLNEANRVAPEDAVVQLVLGDWYLAHHELGAARTHLEAAARALPDEPQVQIRLGMVALRSGDREAARRYAERALELAPDDPGARSLERLVDR